jgi:hypothetical protein
MANLAYTAMRTGKASTVIPIEVEDPVELSLDLAAQSVDPESFGP